MYNSIKNKIIKIYNFSNLFMHKNRLDYKFLTHGRGINNIEKECNIYIQSLGRNTFITVYYNSKLIYNKSIGEYKLYNILLKKKEKRKISNINLFLQYFNQYFFNTLVKKYKIESISIYLNSLPKVSSSLIKDFTYRYNSNVYFAKKACRRYNRFKNRKYLKNKKLLNRLTVRKIFKKKLYLLSYIKSFKTNKLFNIKSINYTGSLSYNGCKGRRMRI